MKFSRITAIIGLIAIFSAAAQQAPIGRTYYELFDAEIGQENTDLYNGTVYTPKYRTVNKATPMLFDEYRVGAISYGGQWFYGVSLSYHVYDDLILMRLPLPSNTAWVRPVQTQVNAFEIQGRLFMNLDQDGLSGFYEQLLQYTDVDLGLYRKLRKKRNLKNDLAYQYSEFPDRKPTYHVKFKGQFYDLNNQNDLKRLFPELRGKIDQAAKEHRKLRKSDVAAFYAQLLQIIHQNISTTL